MRYRDAIRYCQAALQIDGGNALACSLLGDIYRGQGRTDEAIHYYSLAVQLSPPHQKAAVLTKLETLLSREQKQARATGTADARAREASAPAHLAHRQASRRMAIGAFGIALALLILFLTADVKAEPLTDLPWIAGWTAPMLWGMILGGATLGAALALAGGFRPLDEELFLSPAIGARFSGPPVGLMLFLTGGLCFYLAVAVYLIFGVLQESFSRSVMRAFVATFILVCCQAILVPHEAGRQILLFGGNVTFLSLLLGWMLGDFFRPVGGF
jgi:tetratricopeptide (TPR) repeat protein